MVKTPSSFQARSTCRVFVDGQKPSKYLFPSTVWNKPNKLFTDTAVKNPENGINLNKRTIEQLLVFSFENSILKL